MFFELSEGQRLRTQISEGTFVLSRSWKKNDMERTSLNLKESGITPQMWMILNFYERPVRCIEDT